MSPEPRQPIRRAEIRRKTGETQIELDLALDGTERRRQRPQDAAEQKAHYSGKKKTHTDKNIGLVRVYRS